MEATFCTENLNPECPESGGPLIAQTVGRHVYNESIWTHHYVIPL